MSKTEFIDNLTLKPFDLVYLEWINTFGFIVDGEKTLIQRRLLELVNQDSEAFLWKGSEFWLNKGERTSLMELLPYYPEQFELILRPFIILIEPLKLMQFLKDLNLYSYKCLLAFTKYRSILNRGELLESFEYPEKLNLENYI